MIDGVYCASVTPLKADLAPDLDALAAHARALIADGCDGIALLGTTGEANSFSLAERRAILEAAVGAVGAERLMPGTGVNALPETVDLTRHALSVGVTRAVMLPPSYYKGVSDEGLFRASAQAIEAIGDTRLRVLLYHIPQVSGVALSHAVIAELLRRHGERIVAIKDSQCDRAHSLGLAEAFMPQHNPQLGVHVGNELDLPALAARGSRGAVSGLANFMPRVVHHLATEPDAARTADDLARVQRLLAWILGGYALIPALKAIMAAQTGDAAWLRVRAPLAPLDAERFDVFRRELTAHALDPARD